MFGGINMKIVKYLIKYCLNFVLLGLVFFSSILYTFGVDDFDFLFLENIGNLVCPAEFDTGASINITILSVPEGDDKPLKYPLMFSVCDLVIISKIDTLDYFDFDIDQAKVNILNLNPNAKIICLSAKTGEGMNEFIQWIKENKNN